MPADSRITAKAHANSAQLAAATIAAILDGTWDGLDHDRGATLLACAKQLESAGCYVRRANAKGQLS